MEMFTGNETRRRLFAVALFFGVSATAAQTAAAQTEVLNTDDTTVVEMQFFNANEFGSAYDFDGTLADATKQAAAYWQNVLNLRYLTSPWQIALATAKQPILDGEIFSFDNATLVQDNYLAQMLQGNRQLATFDLKALAKDSSQTQLQTHAPKDGSAALTVVNVGKFLGANRDDAINGWNVDIDTILPNNEQAADFASAMRLQLAKSLGEISLTGDNVSKLLRGSELDKLPGLTDDTNYKNYTTFTEAELAALQDLGFDLNRKDFYGRSIYSSGGNVVNARDFTSDKPLAVGLHVWGKNNSVGQSGNITLTGNGAAGIRVDGSQNQITVTDDSTIQSDGTRGKGILISYGRDHNLSVNGDISAAGNAVEFNFGSNALGATGEYRGSYLRYLRGVDANGNITSAENLALTDELNGALVDDFNLAGNLRGSCAIYIGKNALVKNININDGATLEGDIISDWKHFTAADGFLTAYPVTIQYDGKTLDAAKYVPDLVTNLNFNAKLSYGGNIFGADNIKMHVLGGTLKFSGAADILSVDVMSGAKLYGGTFNLNNMSADPVESFTDDTTGTFVNHGTIAADSPNTNLIINGDLLSDGVIQKVSGGSEGKIIINGNANVEGSTVTTDNRLPGETETVLIAESVSGNIKNPVGNPVRVSGMLKATGEIVGNTITVTTYETAAENDPDLDAQGKETIAAMNNMFDKLTDDAKREEMRELYNLEPKEAKKTLSQIGSNDSAQVMSVAQQNTAVDKMISKRVTQVLMPEYIDVSLNPLNYADDDKDSAMTIRVKVPNRRENNFWLNYMKNWGSLRGGTDYHGSVIVGGYDRPVGRKIRAGVFATYGTIGYGADSSRATVYDTRVGVYTGWHNRASDFYFYANSGQLRNSLHRGLSSLGLSTNANYKSHIVEVGGEFKYDLTPLKRWHVSPFVNVQMSYLRQNGYSERGAGIYNQHVAADNNTYFAAQTGLDFKRYYRSGMFGLRFGVKHGFTGADPDLQISYEGNSENTYRLRNKRDKTHFLFSVRGENEFARGWSLGGEAEFQRGDNDKDVTASLMLRRVW